MIKRRRRLNSLRLFCFAPGAVLPGQLFGCHTTHYGSQRCIGFAIEVVARENGAASSGGGRPLTNTAAYPHSRKINFLDRQYLINLYVGAQLLKALPEFTIQ